MVPKSNVFLSYSHKDKLYFEQAISHLKVLERSGKISAWHDRKIEPGTNWKNEIDNNLNEADVIVALVSSDFISSDYCYGIEMTNAFSRHKSYRSILIPVIVRPILVSETPFGEIQALPANAKPISEWHSNDEAWKNVTQAILHSALKIEKMKQNFIKMLDLQPMFDFYKDRNTLLVLEGDSVVFRNIKRLVLKNAKLGEQLISYVSNIQKSYEPLLKAIWSETYAVLFSAPLMQLTFVHVSLQKHTEKIFELLNKELEILNGVEESKFKPELFGLPNTTKSMKDMQKIMELTMSNMKNIASGFNEIGSIAKDLKRIGEEGEGEEFEDVDGVGI